MAESISSVETVTAPALVGVWVFDPTAPDLTELNFLHADGRTESIDVGATRLVVRGRARPLLEFSDAEEQELKLTIFIPFGEGYTAGVKWWEDAIRNRRAINYRDNRGRLIWAGIEDSEIEDGRAGTALALTLLAIDYAEAV